jgi:hypothetical protein
VRPRSSRAARRIAASSSSAKPTRAAASLSLGVIRSASAKSSGGSAAARLARARQQLRELCEIGGLHGAVGAGDHDDRVGARRVHADRRDARRARRGDDARDVNALGGEAVAQRGAEQVVADPPDHARHDAEAGAGHRLVGALAARRGGEALAANRLARARQALGPGHHVHVDAADDDGVHSQPFQSTLREPRDEALSAARKW